MTHHLLQEMDWDWLGQVTNCFLIRDPREVIAPYVRTRPNPTLADIGIPQQAKIFDRVVRLTGNTPVVIDAKDVLRGPRRMLGVLCSALGITFSESMLRWPAGARESDGVWADHWYTTVQQSTGFVPHVSKVDLLPARLRSLAEACEPHYARLHSCRLQA
jgi:hypothetical protein